MAKTEATGKTKIVTCNLGLQSRIYNYFVSFSKPSFVTFVKTISPFATGVKKIPLALIIIT